MEPDGRDLVATSGVAAVGTGRPVPGNCCFRMAGTGKALVATVVLQLVDEGELALDDTVDRWLPGLVDGNGNDGSRITVRQLLQHTSGLHDDIPGFATPQQYYVHRYDTYTPQEIVARATRHRPDFAAGDGWAYSNTGYVLARHDHRGSHGPPLAPRSPGPDPAAPGHGPHLPAGQHPHPPQSPRQRLRGLPLP
ncbi:beta-lactamase [Streptomyces xiamenensis]|uniref:Beta-lactamase n=1 Tax=Streptomyces xiamenensis TaxID=408015 RepID=A0A0F7CQQ6_9ACTN|nr:beta-lactamase [Streptomyces xiamenensis]